MRNATFAALTALSCYDGQSCAGNGYGISLKMAQGLGATDGRGVGGTGWINLYQKADATLDQIGTSAAGWCASVMVR